MQKQCVDQCFYFTGSTLVFGLFLIILEWYWYVANINRTFDSIYFSNTYR